MPNGDAEVNKPNRGARPVKKKKKGETTQSQSVQKKHVFFSYENQKGLFTNIHRIIKQLLAISFADNMKMHSKIGNRCAFQW